MKSLLTIALLACTPFATLAETTKIDLDALPGKTVYDTATLKPIALTPEGKPLVVALHVEAGQTVPPHATSSGLRLLTVVDGTLYWGDGDVVDASKETIYPQGSVLVIPTGQMHWLSARDGDFTLQVVVMPNDAPTPALHKQLH